MRLNPLDQICCVKMTSEIFKNFPYYSKKCYFFKKPSNTVILKILLHATANWKYIFFLLNHNENLHRKIKISKGNDRKFVCATKLSIRDNLNIRNLLNTVLQYKSSSWTASMYRNQLVVYEKGMCSKSLHITYLSMKKTNEEPEKLLGSYTAPNS